MTSTVVIRMMSGLSYTITLPTEQAHALRSAITRAWSSKPSRVSGNDLHLADGVTARINPVCVESVEVS